MAITVFDVDAYLRQTLEAKFGTLGLVARIKLVYSVHRLAIARTGNPAFDSRCEAWPMGPVFPELYANPQNKSGNASAIKGVVRGYCDQVARHLGATSGRSLAARSHIRFPEWFIAKRNRVNKQISVQMIREQLALIGGASPKENACTEK